MLILRLRVWLLTVLLPEDCRYVISHMLTDHLQEKIDRLVDEQYQLQHGEYSNHDHHRFTFTFTDEVLEVI